MAESSNAFKNALGQDKFGTEESVANLGNIILVQTANAEKIKIVGINATK